MLVIFVSGHKTDDGDDDDDDEVFSLSAFDVAKYYATVQKQGP